MREADEYNITRVCHELASATGSSDKRKRKMAGDTNKPHDVTYSLQYIMVSYIRRNNREKRRIFCSMLLVSRKTRYTTLTSIQTCFFSHRGLGRPLSTLFHVFGE